MEFTPARPGSAGEHELQKRFGTTERANRFYSHQMLDFLNDRMQIFVGRQEMIFISTADAHGECDSSFRAGPPGFVRVLDERRITWPEYRGNGVLASVGNISENPHVGLLMIDFVKDVIGLHINGKAKMVTDEEMRRDYPWLIEDDAGGRSPERWVVVDVEEAYVHCSKHIPRMVRVPIRRAVGTGENRREFKRKGGDYFAARDSPSPWKEALDPERPAAGPESEPTAAPEPVPGAVPAPEPAIALNGERSVEAELTPELAPGVASELAAEVGTEPLLAAVGEYDTCGLDLPDGEPAEAPWLDLPDDLAAPVGSPSGVGTSIDEGDGPIWGELISGRDRPPWHGRLVPRRTNETPGPDSADKTGEGPLESDRAGQGPADNAASSDSTDDDLWSSSEDEVWSSATTEDRWVSTQGERWTHEWSEHPMPAHEDEPGERAGDQRSTYVGGDATATLLFGAGFDPYGSGSRRRERDDLDGG